MCLFFYNTIKWKTNDKKKKRKEENNWTIGGA